MNYTQEQTQNIHEQTFAFLEIDEAENVLTITLDRAEKKNALHPVLVSELAYALNYAHYNNEIWAVILKAKGNVFCAGADLKAFMGGGADTDSTIPEPKEMVLIGEVFNKLYKPCIAQVDGDVYAGGFLLLCGCTHVVAKKGIKLGLPEVKRGLFPYQVMAGLLQVMPARKVLDWCIQGYNLPVETAHKLGLVTHLVEEDTSFKVEEIISTLKTNSPSAIRMGLEAYDKINPQESQHEYL
ncbi:MAG: enoyl-CoA hydratase-related protein, partial [Saprospiraceae bacterium]